MHELWRSARGAVAVEAAIVVALFVGPTLLSLYDIDMLYQGQAAVNAVLQNSMTYVMNAGSSATPAGVQNAAVNPNRQAVAVSATTVCYCVPTMTSTPTMPTAVACGTSCATNFVFQQFMSLTATTQVTIPFPVPWVSVTSPYTVTARGMVRTG